MSSILLNDTYYIENIYIFDNGNIKAVASCYFEAKYMTKRLDLSEYEITDQHAKIYLSEAKKVNKNHIEANAKRKQSFFVVLPSAYRYESPKANLYICADIVGEFETLEAREEREQGCINISYDNQIYFKENVIQVLEPNYHFFKTFEEARKVARGEIYDTAERIANLKENKSLFKRDKSGIIKAYEEKLKEGFNFVAFCYDKRFINGALYCHNKVDHYEKSAEYLRAEKIAETMSNILKNKVYTYEVLNLLKVFNINFK